MLLLDRSKVGNRDMDVGKPLDPVYIHRMVSRLKPDAVFKVTILFTQFLR